MDEGLLVTADVKESGAFGGADPLVEVARAVGGGEFAEVEGKEAGGVGGVEEGVDAAGGEFADDPGCGEDQAGGAGDVGEEDQTRVGG